MRGILTADVPSDVGEFNELELELAVGVAETGTRGMMDRHLRR